MGVTYINIYIYNAELNSTGPGNKVGPGSKGAGWT